jgi:coxsackievirus/adenovirus receptor
MTLIVNIGFLFIFLILFLHYANSCYVYPPDKKDPCADVNCENGALCLPSVDGMSAQCQCIEKCYDYGDSVNSRPVCGVNGVDYKNVCELKKASCLGHKEIKVKYYGKCGK